MARTAEEILGEEQIKKIENDLFNDTSTEEQKTEEEPNSFFTKPVVLGMLGGLVLGAILFK